MIPRIVHVLEFKTASSPAFPEVIQAAKKSQEQEFKGWKKMLWTEKEFLEFTKEQQWYIRNAEALLELGAWAIISDIIRLYALYSYGGIYVDWDLEFQQKIANEMFAGASILGFEPYTIAGKGTAQVGAQFLLGEQGQALWRLCYESLARSLWTESFCILPSILTRVLEKDFGLPHLRSKHNYYYLQQSSVELHERSQKNTVRIYPQEYFYPKEGLSSDVAKSTAYSIAKHWEHSQKVTRMFRKGQTAHRSWPQYLSRCRREP